MSTTEVAWWAEVGPEECAHCLRAHHVEVSVRCVRCDLPVCPFCVVTVRRTGERICPGCREEGDEG